MRHLSGFSFGLGLVTGMVLFWAGLKLSKVSGSSAGGGLLKLHSRAGGIGFTGISDFFLKVL